MKEFKLDNQPKIKPGFTIPEGYFETFSSQLLSEIDREPKIIPLKRQSKSWIYAAAAVLVLTMTIPAINQFSTNDRAPNAAAIENYINYAGIPNEQIVELLDSEDIAKIEIDYQLDQAVIEDALYSNPNIQNYIMEQL